MSNRFELIKTFIIVVPKEYDNIICFRVFRKKCGKDFCHFNPRITDDNYKKTAEVLKPESRFKVKIFRINDKRVTSEECVAKTKEEGGVLLGPKGLIIAYEQKKSLLPKDKGCISFDDKENLWQDADGNHRMPFLYMDSEGDIDFLLGYFDRDCGDDACILCFCEMPSNV